MTVFLSSESTVTVENTLKLNFKLTQKTGFSVQELYIVVYF